MPAERVPVISAELYTVKKSSLIAPIVPSSSNVTTSINKRRKPTSVGFDRPLVN